MEINIVKLNFLDVNSVHISERAWKYSRNNDTSLLNKILSVDLPVNEIPSAILEIESTIIEREIIASMRDHSMWARSSRVDDPLQFNTVHAHYISSEQYDFIQDSREEILKRKKEKQRQDEYRMPLPVIASTSYTVNLNLRSMIALYRFFINLREEGGNRNFPKEIWRSAAKKFAIVIDQMTYYNFCENLKFKRINILPKNKELTNGKIGGFITFSGEISFSLRTHLIRHRLLLISDGLLDMIQEKNFYGYNLESKILVNITSTEDFWSKITSTRSCWISHYKIWRKIIESVSKYFSANTEHGRLPCHECNCPFSIDNQARIEGKDPNPPCPIYMKEKSLEPNQVQVTRIQNHIIEDERPAVVWNYYLSKLIGDKK